MSLSLMQYSLQIYHRFRIVSMLLHFKTEFGFIVQCNPFGINFITNKKYKTQLNFNLTVIYHVDHSVPFIVVYIAIVPPSHNHFPAFLQKHKIQQYNYTLQTGQYLINTIIKSHHFAQTAYEHNKE
jgi:hypothetical protein